VIDYTLDFTGILLFFSLNASNLYISQNRPEFDEFVENETENKVHH
jgi:hypothetical protein